MSRIDELIAGLCPNGVNYEEIGAVAQCHSGATPASSVAAYWEGGTIPWMSSGEVSKGTVFETDTKITQSGYDSCSTKMVPPPAVVVALAGQGKTRGTVARTRVSLCTNQSLCSIVSGELVDSDFLYHFLRTQYRQLRSVSTGDGARGGLNLQLIRGYRIPVPPLAVQREIVRVLDTFTELEADLEAELEARRRQYEHYRAELLTFLNEDGVRRIAMGELTQGIASGKNKSRASEGEYPVYGSTGLLGYCRHAAYSGDALLIARVGANAGLVSAVSGDFDVSDNTLVVRPTAEWNLRFAFHQLTKMDLNQYAIGGGQPLVTGGLLKQLEIPVPPPGEQKRIADILDTFYALVNGLSIGIPAELSARRKQYEHYRERLLTFEEAA